MTTDFPTPFATAEPGWPALRARPDSKSKVVAGSWRYECRRASRAGVIAALLVSAALHCLLFFGAMLQRKKVAVAAPVEEAPIIRLAIPELKDLEEPEPVATDDNAPPVDLAIPVPMQADLPQLPRPNDFVQPLNIASLLEQPDINKSTISIIPDHFTRAARIAESIGKIFNLEDLDRHPEPVLQPAPTYPFALRREALSATVLVEFIVDVQGRVLEAIAVDSTHQGFNENAVAGVSKWKFKPGMKGGRKVNVRMRVPIVFKIMDPVD